MSELSTGVLPLRCFLIGCWEEVEESKTAGDDGIRRLVDELWDLMGQEDVTCLCCVCMRESWWVSDLKSTLGSHCSVSRTTWLWDKHVSENLVELFSDNSCLCSYCSTHTHISQLTRFPVSVATNHQVCTPAQFQSTCISTDLPSVASCQLLLTPATSMNFRKNVSTRQSLPCQESQREDSRLRRVGWRV